MHQRLRSLLSGISTTEQADLIVRAVALLEERGFVDFQDSLEQDMMGMAEQPGEIVQYVITQRLVPFYNDMLQNMGVELAEETALSSCIDVFEWLCRVENFDDAATLNNLAVSDNDDAEILADILAVVSATEADAIFPLFDTVSPYLIKRIAALTDVAAVADRQQSEAYRRATERIQNLQSRMAPLGMLTFFNRIVTDHVRMGGDAAAMLATLTPVFASFTRDEKACAVAIVVAASNTPDSEMSKIATTYMQEQASDVLVAVNIAKNTVKLLQEVTGG